MFVLGHDSVQIFQSEVLFSLNLDEGGQEGQVNETRREEKSIEQKK
jgi:hypothetical protein